MARSFAIFKNYFFRGGGVRYAKRPVFHHETDFSGGTEYFDGGGGGGEEGFTAGGQQEYGGDFIGGEEYSPDGGGGEYRGVEQEYSQEGGTEVFLGGQEYNSGGSADGGQNHNGDGGQEYKNEGRQKYADGGGFDNDGDVEEQKYLDEGGFSSTGGGPTGEADDGLLQDFTSFEDVGLYSHQTKKEEEEGRPVPVFVRPKFTGNNALQQKGRSGLSTWKYCTSSRTITARTEVKQR